MPVSQETYGDKRLRRTRGRVGGRGRDDAFANQHAVFCCGFGGCGYGFPPTGDIAGREHESFAAKGAKLLRIDVYGVGDGGEDAGMNARDETPLDERGPGDGSSGENGSFDGGDITTNDDEVLA